MSAAGGAIDSGEVMVAQGLRVRLGDAEVLHDVSVSMAPGRWTAIVGPNGAGKTTLLRALAHVLPARHVLAGGVRLQGRDIATCPRRERARVLGWLGQNEEAGADLLAYDVAMLGRLPHQSWLSVPTAEDASIVEHAMRLAHCWEWRHRTLGNLSGGERQRVLLARALAVQARVMLMDEPLANLDAPHQADWLGIVRQLAQDGCTVVSVLHELGMALQADEIVVMRAGRIVHQGASGDAATREAMVEVFDGRIGIHEVAGQWAVVPVVARA
ncbi:ABC transporter ATP-binding protein [Variovorax sp. VNK109]|uniref:ABC transporter ATP-binding protein n=1 Tax=Variovorax sp. VNK109 TaxID=3400919 RepID=UPI003C0D17D5